MSCAASYNIGTEIQKGGFESIDTLVDVGCGNGQYDADLFWRYRNMHFVLEDLDLKYARANERFYMEKGKKYYFKDRCDMYTGTDSTIPLPSSAYKTVLCRKALHEFTYPDKMVMELKRILRPNGTLIILEAVPLYAGQIDTYCKRAYLTKEYIVQLMQSNGFTLTSADSTDLPVKKSSRVVNFNLLKFTNNLLKAISPS